MSGRRRGMHVNLSSATPRLMWVFVTGRTQPHGTTSTVKRQRRKLRVCCICVAFEQLQTALS